MSRRPRKSVEGHAAAAWRVCGSQEPESRSYRATMSGLGGDFEQRQCSCGRWRPFLSLGMASLGDMTLAAEIQGRWSLTTQP